MPFSDLSQLLNTKLAQLPPGKLVVGYSGGLDSSTLLHALAQLPAARTRGLRVLHVNHGLHAHSVQWAKHCHKFAQQLDLQLQAITVTVPQTGGTGPEDAARRMRYAAFAQALQPGEILALAHHRDDQAETVLLKLLRGAGPQGLGGMHTLREFAQGYLWRPLLDQPRDSLCAYAQSNKLAWIDDPSNADIRLRRNFLRAQILPSLANHWPEATVAIAHSAMWSRAAAKFIDDEAAKALARMQGTDPSTLSWRAWLDLPDALRDPVLRQWLRALGLPEPTHFHISELEHQLRNARADRLPCINWQGTELRRHRDLLYAMAPLTTIPHHWESRWHDMPLALPTGDLLMMESTTRADHPIDVSALNLSVRYRRGGEHIKPASNAHTRELRLLLQEAGIPPWQRARIPLIYHGENLLAVGDLFLSAAGRDLCDRLDARIIWTRFAN